MPLPAAISLLVGALCMWIVDYIRTPELWLTIFSAQMLVLLNAILLCMTLYRAKATAHFSLLPAVLYVLAVGVFPFLREHWQPQLTVTILLFFLYMTRDMTDAHEPNGLVFFVTLLLCLAALLSPDAVWCIVFLWIVVLLQGSFTLRTIVASLLAVALVSVYYLLAIYFGWEEQWNFSVLFDRHWFGSIYPACVIASVVCMMIAFLLATSGAFQRSSYDLVSTRMLLYHVVFIGLLSAPLILFSAVYPDYWLLLPLALASTTSIYLLQKQSESRGITLLVYITGAVALYLWLLLTL
ncbi:MAG: hypothetical protein J6W89_05840 [Paludibacteraceae bacterium]|nr:hypothetical protein [Paludibacteraceae bacterium]